MARARRSRYDKIKAEAAQRRRQASLAGRDVAVPLRVTDVERRKRGAKDFEFFCKAYFPLQFTLPFSADHRKVIAKIESAVLRGGLFAVAMPRGSGKTILCECACIWALLNGHREFVCLIGSDEGHAEMMLDAIKIELETNDLLDEDYPEVTHAIRALEGISNRCAGQLWNGERTHIRWTSRYIVLPTVRVAEWQNDGHCKEFVRPNGLSLASGGIIRVAGITGRIRGMTFRRPDGTSVRPNLVIVDDPQTDESARSPSQCDARERVLCGAILNLAGPGQKISGIMPCTVIAKGDLADRILDQDKHPEWQGERLKLVYQFPERMDLWHKYAELRADSFRNGGHGEEATEFYRQHRDEMDRGAVVPWPERFNPDEISAIQHAMNLRFLDELAFFSEYQNEPLDESAQSQDALTTQDVMNKINKLLRYVVPTTAELLTAYIDVQANILFYVVVAWQKDFAGYVIDYGTYPEQPQQYFTVARIRKTLQKVTGKDSLEGAIYAGLEALVDQICGRDYKRQDGTLVRIKRCLIDAAWGAVTDLVFEFCRLSNHAAVLTPAMGRFVGASSRPLNSTKQAPGTTVGLHWRLSSAGGARSVRYLVYDTNFWKSFTAARLRTGFGEAGCLSLYGKEPRRHRLFADHITAEYPVRVESGERVVDEWKMRPPRRDNHYWDCLVGAMVAASLEGCELPGMRSQSGSKQERVKISFAELQRMRRLQRAR